MSELKRVVKLANQLSDATTEVERLTQELKDAKKIQLGLEREDLPTLMNEIGLTELTLENGQKIKIEEDCDTSITEATRERAIAWLSENGFGGLIKTAVLVEFGRGEVAEAHEAAEALMDKYPQTRSTETVHHSTLKAFVKEQLSEGANFPMDLFNVHSFSKAVIRK
jgi:hypothetical protein